MQSEAVNTLSEVLDICHEVMPGLNWRSVPPHIHDFGGAMASVHIDGIPPLVVRLDLHSEDRGVVEVCCDTRIMFTTDLRSLPVREALQQSTQMLSKFTAAMGSCSSDRDGRNDEAILKYLDLDMTHRIGFRVSKKDIQLFPFILGYLFSEYNNMSYDRAVRIASAYIQCQR
jgi:hypothetical protein